MRENASRWRQIEEIGQAALERAPGEREAFLREACADDSALRREVEGLLANAADAGAFLEQPIGAVAAQVMDAPGDGVWTGRTLNALIIGPLIGAGGMGQVYRARDTELHRDVAVKVLPPGLARDADRLARFAREARVLASLNHPNIAQIHAFEHIGDATALVMELVEGETLADRIARGAIPVDETLQIARQVAEALEAAHEQGVIHRDLKPANIKLRPDGTVKVLDFGLAKALEPRAPAGDITSSPTFRSPAVMTDAGMILGTAAYMSPEQARGKPVDKRADIWAFGCVLFEMLTGSRAFEADDVSLTLAAVLKSEPDWNRLSPQTPPSVRRLLRRCLAKDPKLRLREAGSAIVDIHDALSGEDDRWGKTANEEQQKSARRRLMLPTIAALAFVTLGSVAVWMTFAPGDAPAPQPVRFTITLPTSDELPLASGGLLAISPDGRTLVYKANRNAVPQLFRRPLDQFEATPLSGAEGGSGPSFSPDGQWVDFVADGVRKRVPLAGGPPQTLTQADGTSVTSDSGAIVFFQGGSLMRIVAGGGDAEELFTGDPRKLYSRPQILPGGRAVLFAIRDASRAPDSGELHLLRLDSREHRTLVANVMTGRLLRTGHLVFIRSGALWAVPFDVERLETVGNPVPVVEGVRVESGGAVQFQVADNGTLVYIPSDAASRRARKLLIVHRNDGREEPINAQERDYVAMSLSRDQTRAALQIGDGDEAEIWVVDIARGSLTRVTREWGFDGSPLWSHDDTRVVFASSREGRWELRGKSADGTGEAEVLARFDQTVDRVRPYSWVPDGSAVLVEMLPAGRARSLLAVVPTDGKSNWKPMDTTSYEGRPTISPDGRWMAYESDEAGRVEVYVRRFPDLRDRRQISMRGGRLPTWSRDGSELLYLEGEPVVAMRVAFQTNKVVGSAIIGRPERIFDFPYYARPFTTRFYDVARDGQRFLVMSSGADAGPETRRQIRVVVNWYEELKRLVPVP